MSPLRVPDASMVRGRRDRDGAPDGKPRQIAPGVFCLGPWGRTGTNAYAVRSGGAWALVDTGWSRDAPRVERAAARLFGPDVPPAAVLLTHFHPDHAGGARRLAERWDCAVHLHPEELPVARGDLTAPAAAAGPLDRLLVLPLMRAAGKRRREAALARSSLGPLARPLPPRGDVPGLPDWQWVPTPGHTPGHVCYFRPRDRVLIAGDALVTLRIGTLHGLLLPRPGLSGPPWYTTWNRAAARASARRLARLEPAVLAAGHGEPLTGPDTAGRIRAFLGPG